MSIIEQDGTRFIEINNGKPPPHVDAFFDMMKELNFPLPTLANIDPEKEVVSTPAAIAFMHEAWSLGCKAWFMHTSEDESLESGIDAAVASCVESKGTLNYYLWCVWTDMMGFDEDYSPLHESRDHFLARKAREIATVAVDMLRTDAEGAA
jgi:hypothetical protein